MKELDKLIGNLTNERIDSPYRVDSDVNIILGFVHYPSLFLC